jgi:1-acyl-sn-glycerol-3-phosphate acyltransferase
VFVANHQSYFDLVALLAFLPGRVRFVVTTEMARHPLWGRIVRGLGMIVLDEADTAPDTLAAELERITADGSVLIFPEGRRSGAGRVLPFMPLPFMAIVALGVPVVPVAVRGTSDVLPPGGGQGVWPGDVDLIVEGPIPTDHLIPGDYHPLREDVRTMIARYVEDLDALLGAGAIEEADGREAGAAEVTGFVPVAHAARA